MDNNIHLGMAVLEQSRLQVYVRGGEGGGEEVLGFYGCSVFFWGFQGFLGVLQDTLLQDTLVPDIKLSAAIQHAAQKHNLRWT